MDMPRKPLVRTSLYPYHVTSRANNKEWFELPLDQVWDICIKSMRAAYYKHPVDIISFVLMGNHYHLLVQTPHSNLDQFMYELNKNIAIDLKQRTGRINKIFGGRYKWCLISNMRYLANCYRYIYQNPLRANITKRCQDYPFSTLYYKSRGLHLGIPLCDKLGLADQFKLCWLNQKIEESEEKAIRSALYRSVLSNLKDRKDRKKVR